MTELSPGHANVDSSLPRRLFLRPFRGEPTVTLAPRLNDLLLRNPVLCGRNARGLRRDGVRNSRVGGAVNHSRDGSYLQSPSAPK